MIAGPSASAAKILDKSKQLKPQPVPVAPVEAAKPAVQIASHQLPSSAGENKCNQALLIYLIPPYPDQCLVDIHTLTGHRALCKFCARHNHIGSAVVLPLDLVDLVNLGQLGLNLVSQLGLPLGLTCDRQAT